MILIIIFLQIQIIERFVRIFRPLGFLEFIPIDPADPPKTSPKVRILLHNSLIIRKGTVRFFLMFKAPAKVKVHAFIFHLLLFADLQMRKLRIIILIFLHVETAKIIPKSNVFAEFQRFCGVRKHLFFLFPGEFADRYLQLDPFPVSLRQKLRILLILF